MNFYFYIIVIRVRNFIRGLFAKGSSATPAKVSDKTVLTRFVVLIILTLIIISVWRYSHLYNHYIRDNNLVAINIDIAIISLVLYFISRFFRLLLVAKKERSQESFFYKVSPDKRKYALWYFAFYFVLAVLFMLSFIIPSVIIGLQYGITHYLTFPPLLFLNFIIFTFIAMLGDLYYHKMSFIEPSCNPKSPRRVLDLVTKIAFGFFVFSALFYILDVEYQVEYASSISLFLKILYISLLVISLHTIFFLPALKKTLFAKYPFMKDDSTVHISQEGSLVVDNLDFSYHIRQILSNVSFGIEPKKTYALIGLNGSGKTTLLNLLRDYSYNLKTQYQTNYLFMQSDSPILEKMTIPEFMEALKLLNSNLDIAEMNDLLEKYHIDHSEEKQLRNYSHNDRLTISYIAAIALGVQFYLIDAPFNSPECETTEMALDSFHILKKTKKSMIIATNFLDIAYSVADEILLISDKSIKQIKNDFATFASFEHEMLALMSEKE